MGAPRVIAFEGVDGAGKSTVIQRVAQALRARGRAVFLPREGKEHDSRPTRMIRRLARDPRNLDLCARSELALYCAREAQVIEECVRPALARGETVLLDRCLLTPVVLGAWGRGLPRQDCEQMAYLAEGGVAPDVTMVFDVHPRTSRIRKRVEKVRTKTLGGGGRKGLAGSGLKERVREGYKTVAVERGYPLFHVERISPDTLAERVLKVLVDGARVEDLEDDMDGVPQWQMEPGLPLTEGLRAQRPEVAIFLSNGLALGRPFRAEQLDADPALVAWALDVEDPLRERAAELEPEYAFRGWARKPLEEDDLRLRHLEHAPAAVLRALKYSADALTDGIRKTYADRAPGAVAASLIGREDDWAYELRKTVWKDSEPEDRSTSISLCGSDRAWHLREKLLDKAPATALTSLRGLVCERTNQALERYGHLAPKAALRAVGGRTDAFAHELRRALLDTGREVIDSVRGLEDDDSWRLREEHSSIWPSTVIHSLMGIDESQRAQHLIEQCVRAAAGDLHATRRLCGLEERKSRPEWAQERGVHAALDD